jgi:hypothetical protein
MITTRLYTRRPIEIAGEEDRIKEKDHENLGHYNE